MSFRHPLLLAGLAAVVLPWVLHLLGRARARTVPWGATLLLDAAGTDAGGFGRSRDVTLLVLRGLAIAALAVALADPAGRPADAAAGGAAVVIVIDASPSMARPDANATRLELARRAALDRLGRLRQGDQAGLVVVGVAGGVDVAVTPDRQSVASQVVSLGVGPLAGDLAEGERRARAMLADAGIDGGEIDLIADRQRTAWESLGGVEAAPGARLVAVPIGSTRTADTRVESIDVLDAPLIVGQPARVAVRVRNDGGAPQGGLPLRVTCGVSDGDDGPVAIDARGVTRAVRTLTPRRAGPAVITATLPHGGLPADDTLRVAVDVLPRPGVRVLSSTTRPASTRPVGAMDVLPFDAAALGSANVVVIDAAVPDAVTVAAVEQFVAGGGALLVAAGPALPMAAWNARLWKGGFGLAPAATADVALPQGGSRLRLAPGPSEGVIDRADADPIAIERTFGRGRVIAVAEPLGEGPRTAALVRRLLAGPPSRNLDLGVPIEATFRAPRERSATVYRPDGRADRVPLLVTGSEAVLRYARTDLPGRYAVRAGDGPTIEWFVRADPAEADPAMLDDTQLATLLVGTTIGAPNAAPPHRGEIDWPAWVLAFVALTLGGELVLADRYVVRRARP